MPHYTKKLTKIVKGLKKASRTHGQQARTLAAINKDQKTRYSSNKHSAKKPAEKRR